jgi:transposase
MKAITVGLDIAKSVFQAHVEDAEGRIIVQRRLRRAQVAQFFARLPASVVGIEACGSAHYWGRQLRALGHEVRLIPAAYVKPFVRRNKTDARDAAATCTALKHPDMRFVALKSAGQQASRGLERARELLVKQHTQLRNSVRSQLAEHGLVAAQGRRGFAQLAALLAAGDARIPAALVPVLRLLLEQIERLAAAIAQLEARIGAAAKADPAMRRLATIPGVGPILAHAIVAAAGAPAGSSARRAPSPPGRGSRRARIRAPADTGTRASAGRATVACASCSRSAPARSCAACARAASAPPSGSRASWRAGR